MRKYLDLAFNGAHKLRRLQRNWSSPMVIKHLFVPDYVYAARTSDELVPIFEQQFYKQVEEYDADILFDDAMHEMAKRIGYTFFSDLKHKVKCPADVQIEEIGDQGFSWRFVPAALPRNPVVYGFGAGTNISFEIEFARKYGCDVHCFDPTPQAVEYVKGLLAENPRIKFHAVGLIDIDGKVKFFKPRQKNLGSLSALNLNASTIFMEANVQRLRTLMARLGHERIDLLKLDIEGAEHRSLEDLIFSELDVGQIAVEFDQPVPPWRIERTMGKLFLNGYSLIDCWGLNCLFVRNDLLPA
jgi:FkbM family methyltransferase